MREVPIEIAAYAAGFFDGEGNVDIQYHQSRQGGGPWVFRIMVTNTDQGIIKWFAEQFGGRTFSQQQKAHWKEVHRWTAWGEDAVNFLNVVEPFIRVKREAVTLGLVFGRTRKDRSKNEYLSEEEQCLRERVVEDLRRINRRGREAPIVKEE